MGTLNLKEDSFWQSYESFVLANPRDAEAVAEAEVIRDWLVREEALTGHVLFRTSGSSGKGKWVALSKNSVLISARAVNELLSVTKEDRWLQSLPLFHVGGMGIAARAYEAGCEVCGEYQKWNPVQFHETLEDGKITLTSMVPTQLVDLLRLKLTAPPSLRAILLGGGRLSDDLYQQAAGLGWPIRETYGMTETASQVATAAEGKRDLDILPCWDVRSVDGGRLSIRGEAVMSFYLSVNDGGCTLSDPKQKGWFVTNDLGRVSEGVVSIKGRIDRCVKILGELVNLVDVESAIGDVLRKRGAHNEVFAVVAEAGERESCSLVFCSEGGLNDSNLLDEFNAGCNPLHRINRSVSLSKLPYTGIGKINYSELQKYVQNDTGS